MADMLWQIDARFRHRWRISAVIWGTGLLIDAAVRVVLSYTMSVDQVPALTGSLSIVTLVVLQGIDQIQLRRGGVFTQLIEAGRAGPAQDSRPPVRPPAAP